MSDRRKGELVRELLEAADRPSAHLRGGFANRIRRDQSLMREAAIALSRWGRPQSSRLRQPDDMLNDGLLKVGQP